MTAAVDNWTRSALHAETAAILTGALIGALAAAIRLRRDRRTT